MDRFKDPEMSYRRSYEHDAWELFKAIEHLLPVPVRTDARRRIQRDVRNWRADNIAGKIGTAGRSERPNNRYRSPEQAHASTIGACRGVPGMSGIGE